MLIASLTGLTDHDTAQATDLEVNMNAVERMIEYTSQPLEGSSQTITGAPPQDWPRDGSIIIENLQVSSVPALNPRSHCQNPD